MKTKIAYARTTELENWYMFIIRHALTKTKLFLKNRFGSKCWVTVPQTAGPAIFLFSCFAIEVFQRKVYHNSLHLLSAHKDQSREFQTRIFSGLKSPDHKPYRKDLKIFRLVKECQAQKIGLWKILFCRTYIIVYLSPYLYNSWGDGFIIDNSASSGFQL